MNNSWNTTTVGAVASVRGGKRLPAGFTLQDASSPHPYIRVTDMRDGGVDASAIKYVPPAAATAIRAYRIFRDDIFISVAGTLGIVGRIPPSLDGANLTENADRITEIQCNVDYLCHYLRSTPIQHEIDSIRTVGAQPKLALGRIKAFELYMPSDRGEQEAVAGALNQVDSLHSSLERLIAKKRAIKEGMMQELLTGRTRLAGFNDSGEITNIGDMLSIRRGSILTRSQARPGHVPVVAGGKIPAGYTDKPNRTGRTITISASGASAGYVAIHDVPIFASDCSTISPAAYYDLDFVYYSLFFRQESIYRSQTGGAQPHIHAKDVYPISLWKPPTIDEQRAIGRVLRDVDFEIKALVRRLEVTRNIKQGMMQELLTARTRLPFNEEVTV